MNNVLRECIFSFHGYQESETLRLIEYIRQYDGKLYNELNPIAKDQIQVVYIITSYWIDTLLPKHSSMDYVYVTEYWLYQVIQQRKWVPIDSHIFPFYQPPVCILKTCEYIPGRLQKIAKKEDILQLRFPYSINNVFQDQVPLWPYIYSYLHLSIATIEDLLYVISKVTFCTDTKDFKTLQRLLSETFSKEDALYFIKVVIPEMIKSILHLPELFPEPPQLLVPITRNEEDIGHSLQSSSCTMSKYQIFALLSCCFFGIFPSQEGRRIYHDQSTVKHNSSKGSRKRIEFPYFTMIELYSSKAGRFYSSTTVKQEKLWTILQYFMEATQVIASNVDGMKNQVVTYSRVALQCDVGSGDENGKVNTADLIQSLQSSISGVLTNSTHGEQNYSLSHVRCESTKLIENLTNHLQIDFANKFAGGGVLNNGAVQEEILFCLSPELLVTCLLVAKLEPHEAFVIHGYQRYSSYKGYGSTYEYNGPYQDTDTTFESISWDNKIVQRRASVLVGIDAQPYKHGKNSAQYRQKNVLRELVKATVGFSYPESQVSSWPIGTGNWGCGVFGGDAELKFLIQWIAASLCHRDLTYIIFSKQDAPLQESILNVYNLLKNVDRQIGLHLLLDSILSLEGKQIKAGTVMNYVMSYLHHHLPNHSSLIRNSSIEAQHNPVVLHNRPKNKKYSQGSGACIRTQPFNKEKKQKTIADFFHPSAQ